MPMHWCAWHSIAAVEMHRGNNDKTYNEIHFIAPIFFSLVSAIACHFEMGIWTVVQFNYSKIHVFYWSFSKLFYFFFFHFSSNKSSHSMPVCWQKIVFWWSFMHFQVISMISIYFCSASNLIVLLSLYFVSVGYAIAWKLWLCPFRWKYSFSKQLELKCGSRVWFNHKSNMRW